MQLTKYSFYLIQLSLFLLVAINPVAAEKIDRQTDLSIERTKQTREKLSGSAKDLLLKDTASHMAQNNLTRVTGVELNQTDDGLQVILKTAGEERLIPLILPDGNNLAIDILDATLALPKNEFIQVNPAPGIESVALSEIDESSIRLTITGANQALSAEVVTSEQNLVLNVTPEGVTTEQKPDEAMQRGLGGLPHERYPKVYPLGLHQEEITITATRKEERTEDVPRSVTVISQEEIEKQSRTSRDLPDIIGKTTPGVNPPTGSTRSLSVRGRPAQVLINGVPVTSNISNDTAVADLRAISPDVVERIEVIRGPSALYGDGATGGVINIITKKAAEGETKLTTTLEANAALGGFEEDSIGTFFSQSVSASDKGVSFFGSFSTRNDGIYYDADGDRIPFQDAGTAEADILQLAGTLGFELSENQDLQFSVTHNDEEYDYSIISDTSVDDLPLGATSARALDGEQKFIGISSPQIVNSTLSLNYTHRKLFGNNQLDAQLFYRDYQLNGRAFDGRPFDDPLEVSTTEQTSDRWGGRLQLNTPIVNSVEALSSFDISPIKITAYVENETLPGWDNRLQLLYVSDRNRAVDDGTEFVDAPIEGYTLVDFISSLELGTGILSLGIDNLFDADYATIINQTESFANSATFRGRGRSVRLGYQFDW